MSTDVPLPAPNPTQFQKGVSGNPAGRPPGARNRATALAEQLLEGEARRLVRQAIDRAMGGDVLAMRLCLERILPVLRGTAHPARPAGSGRRARAGGARPSPPRCRRRRGP